jgi:amino acid adenylation domain-containing protein
MTPAESTAPELVHDVVSRFARSAPARLAVADGRVSLTYGDLERRANSLAHRLRVLGVEPGVLVGLCHDRSASTVVGALAVLKAGGGYVALDPNYPDSSLEKMLDDSRAAVLLTQASVIERLSSISCEVLDLDRDADLGQVHPVEHPPLGGAVATDVAYVIYTSGSTGDPKGVAVSHESLLNLVRWHISAFGVTPLDRASMVASPAFDASVWELWPYLVRGASLHVADSETPRMPRTLRQWIVAQGITIGFVPTPMAEALLGLDWASTSVLRIMLTGGDVLHRRPAKGTPFALVNNYGVTEGTVVTTSGIVAPGDPDGVLPSIGRPILNVEVRVLDQTGEPVPPGAPGELYIGGPSVALGYLHRADLTSERFVTGLSDTGSGARLYRTGDSVRMTEVGEFEFLGRLDQQIAIRGYRIEPEEINAALSTHPDVGQCAVVPFSDERGANRLVAYVVPSSKGVSPSRQGLRDHLSARLPRHMVPADFVEIEALPVTFNGKLDRTALPAPHRVRGRPESAAEPRTPTEVVLAEVLGKLLRVQHIGRDDNFFELGGHSLMGAQLIALVQDRFGAELSLLSIFDHPTLSEIASLIDEMRASEGQDFLRDERHLVQVRPGGRPALFCVFPDDVSLVAIRQFPPFIDPQRAVYGLVGPNPGGGYDDTTVEEMAERLLGEILRAQPEGPYLITGYSLGGLIAYALAGRLEDLGHEVRFLGLIDTTSPAERLRRQADELVDRWGERKWRSRAGAVLSGGLAPAVREAVQLARQKGKRFLVRRLHSRPPRPGTEANQALSDIEILDLFSSGYRPVGLDGALVVFVASDRRRSRWPRCLEQTRLEPDFGGRSHCSGHSAEQNRERTLGWSEVHRGPLRTVVVPGEHNTVLAAPNVVELAASLAGAIAEAAAPVKVPELGFLIAST